MKSSTAFSLLLAFVATVVAQDGAKPPVDSASLISGIQSESLLAHAQKFSDFAKSADPREGKNRGSGTTGYNQSIAYIKQELEKTGYYDIQEVIEPFRLSDGNATFTANDKNLNVTWVEFAPAGDVTAPVGLVKGDGCSATDYDGLAGKIAIIKFGGCIHRQKDLFAGDAKAVGLIVYNRVLDSEQLYCSLGVEAVDRPGNYVPFACMSGADGEAIVSTLNSGSEVVGHLNVPQFTDFIGAISLIATTKSGDHDNIVFSGAETDAPLGTPGLNFYGAAAISNLDIAVQLSKYSVKNTVRFAFWALTDLGSPSAREYINHLPAGESKKFALYLEADVLASSNGGYFVVDGFEPGSNATAPAGTDKIAKVFNDYYSSVGIQTQPLYYSTSVYEEVFAFTNASIPAGGISTYKDGNKTAEQVALWGGVAGAPYDSCIGKQCDDVSNLNVTEWTINTKAIANAIATFATSLEGIPPRKA